MDKSSGIPSDRKALGVAREALRAIQTSGCATLHAQSPPADSEDSFLSELLEPGEDMSALNKEEMEKRFLSKAQQLKLEFPPLERLPCANGDPSTYQFCPRDGSMACSACRLVSYCSPVCQRSHWKIHKKDCKSSTRSDDWKPDWLIEGRSPVFVTDDRSSIGRIAEHCILWGNTPATDIIDLERTEKDKADPQIYVGDVAKRRDPKSAVRLQLSATSPPSLRLSPTDCRLCVYFEGAPIVLQSAVAFIAFGDLRHAVYTVNRLPEDYSGHLTFILNDRNPLVVLRNIVLLLVLGKTSDVTIAADIALHFWYSIFIPFEYHTRVCAIVADCLGSRDDAICDMTLVAESKLHCALDHTMGPYLMLWLTSSLTLADVQASYGRARFAPDRVDFWDHIYSRLKPSHRHALLEYRRLGLVLPFGAVNTHFNTPNTSLFGPSGEWIQSDFANPLESWDMAEVIHTGKTHGAQEEDIYGCLYFFVSDQLRSFAHRLRRYKVSFHMVNMDASTLPKAIMAGDMDHLGIPRSIKFDRIHVSNILDKNYLGLGGVLNTWTTLLRRTEHATILGYFLNWVAAEPPARLDGNRNAFNLAIDRLKQTGRFPTRNDVTDITELQIAMYTIPRDAQIAHENWPVFLNYLKNCGLETILKKNKLILRSKNLLVPPRVGVPTGSAPDALPDLSDDRSWYIRVCLGSATFSERYVEFGCIR